MKIKANQTLNNEVEDRTTCLYYAFRNILLVGLPLVLVSAFVLSLPHSTATGSGSTSSSDHVYFNLDTSCTMSSELINPHTVEIHGGQYKTNVGTTKLNTYCNDGNGYSIYAIGSSNSTDGNTDLINSENNNYNIKTGIYDSSTATPNTPSSWSMKLTAGTGSGDTLTPPTIVNDYDDYSIVPNTYTRVASRSSETEMNPNTDITGSYLTTTYAVYASSIQPAGSYSGNVKYVMIHPHVNNNNIGFNEAFAINGKTPITTNDGNNYYAMQDMTSDICNMVSIYDEPSQTQLIDIRDNKLYWVAKLRDGHCWMTQNLGLDLEVNPTSVAPLTSENTDLNDSSLTGAYELGYTYENNVLSWKPSNKTIEFINNSLTSWGSTQTNSRSAKKIDGNNSGHNSLGNYYNWTAAIASNNSGTLTTNTANDISKNPQNSICPKGWRLPTISSNNAFIVGSTSEFARLNYLYNNNSITSDTGMLSYPTYFTRPGFISNSALQSLNTVGTYWSSTVVSSEGSYNIRFSDTYMYPANNSSYYGKYFGFSIRCLAK